MSRLCITIFKGFKVNLLFFPLLISAFLKDYYILFFVSYLTALLHELAHIFCAMHFKIPISFVEVLPFGVCARLKTHIIKNPCFEITIAAVGPMLNIILAIIFYVLPYKNEAFTHLIHLNISMAAINLLPILPLDGGRILKAYLSLKTGTVRAYNISIRISRISIIFLLLFSAFLLIFAPFNFSLILIGAFLFGNLFLEQKNITREALKELLNYKSKLNEQEFSKATVICADKKIAARKILKELSSNKYHIIYIVDNDLNIVKICSEGQVIDALYKKGIRITLEDI